MNARQKLNLAYVNGAVLVAGLLVVFTGNPTLFVVAFGVLLAGAVHSGDTGPADGADRRLGVHPCAAPATGAALVPATMERKEAGWG